MIESIIEEITMGKRKVQEQLRCCILARTSSDDPPDPDRSGFGGSDRPSIEEQIAVCKELATKEGYIFDEKRDVYIDMDLSGRMYPEGYLLPDAAMEKYFKEKVRDAKKKYRPAMAALLDRAGASPVRDLDFNSLSPSKRRYDIIVVRDIFRLCRPVRNSHLGNHLWQVLSALGIKIHSTQDRLIDADEFNDMLITDLKLRLADEALNKQHASSKRSMDRLKNEGQLNTNPCRFGFRPGRRQQVEPVSEELEVVKRIFRMFIEDRLIPTEIAKILNAENVPTMESSRWRTAHINKLLRVYDNPASKSSWSSLSESQKKLMKQIINRVKKAEQSLDEEHRVDLKEQAALSEKRLICQELNKKKCKVINPPVWNMQQVSKILNKPVYSGQNWNIKHELIDAPAFSSEITARHPDFKPPIKKSDFEKVLKIFRPRSAHPNDDTYVVSYGRWYEKGGKRRDRTGQVRFSTKERKARIYPLSGLLRCWNCGDPMTPHRTTDNSFFSYKDAKGEVHSGFDVCYYHCKHYTKNPSDEYKRCKGLSILERYPDKCKRPDKYSQGLPLLEAVYPLLFRAYIEHIASEKLLTPALIKERKECQKALDEIVRIERTYFQKYENEVLDDEQFNIVMADKRDQRRVIQQRLTEIGEQLDKNDLSELPISLSELTHPSKLPPELCRALAFRVFESIVVYPNHVDITLNTDNKIPADQRTFQLEKIRIKRAYRLPWWRASISTKKITPKSKLTIAYFNKSTLHDIHEPIQFAYTDPVMEVVILGDNDPLERRKPDDDTEWTQKSDLLANAFGRGKPKQGTILGCDYFLEPGDTLQEL